MRGARQVANNKVRQAYQQLYNLVLDSRASGSQRLPTESQLSLTLGVSRSTVRDALAKLDAEGEIRRVRHQGTFVNPERLQPQANVPAFPADIVHSLSEFLSGRGLAYAVIELQIVQDIATGEVSQLLDVPPGSTVYRASRVYEVEGHRSAFVEHTLPPNVHGVDIDATKLTEGVTTFLEDVVGLKISHVDAIITAQAADVKLAKALQITEGCPVLCMHTIIRDFDGATVALGSLIFEPSRLRLSVGVDGEWTLGRTSPSPTERVPEPLA